MRPLSDFHPKILPYIQGCPEPALNLALVDTAIDFCERTRAIHQRSDLTVTAPGQRTVDIDFPPFQRVVNVRALWIGERRLNPLPSEYVPGPSTATGAPSWYWGNRTDSFFSVELYPIPDARYEIVADVAYCPTRDAIELEDDLFDLWIDAIRAGTLARLFAIPGQIFSDMATAGSWALGYARAAADAKRRADNTRIVSNHTVRPRPFA